MDWDVEYYETERGEVPVVDFLLSLPKKVRAKTFSEIELLKKHGMNLREPYVKPIKGDKYNGLFELRTKFASDVNRIFYFAWSNNRFVLLNGFVKKDEKTPKIELDRALAYKKDYERRCNK